MSPEVLAWVLAGIVLGIIVWKVTRKGPKNDSNYIPPPKRPNPPPSDP